MRLKILESGHRPVQKLFLRLVRLVAGGTVPPPILVASYRGELFGKPFVASMHEGMRKATEWSVAECEIFAAFISRLNACHY